MHRVDTAPLPEFPVRNDSQAGNGTRENLSPDHSWWRNFGDPVLDRLVENGLEYSPDLQAVWFRVRQAEAIARGRQALRGPEIGLSGSTSSEFQHRNERSDTHRGGVTATWDPDFFGGQRFAAMEGFYRFRAQEEAFALARLNLSGEITNTYLDLVGFELIHLLIEGQKANAEEYLHIVEARARQGIVSRLDVLQQAGQVLEIDSQVPPVLSEIRRAQLRLAVLTGQNPDTIEEIRPPLHFPQLPEKPGPGQPLQLVSERPDLRLAQNELVAADAGAAALIAASWPSLNASVDAFWREGVSARGEIVSLALHAFQPLFDGGRRRADRDGAEALVEEKRAIFLQVFLQSIAEVEESFYAEQQQADLLGRLNQQRGLAAETLEQAMERYSAGLTDLLPVISARENLNTLDQRILHETRDLFKRRVNLHAALVGPIAAPASLSDEG